MTIMANFHNLRIKNIIHHGFKAITSTFIIPLLYFKRYGDFKYLHDIYPKCEY